MFQVGSHLSFDVNLVGFTTNIIPNIPEISMSSLPLSFTTEKHAVAPKNWVLSEDERAFLSTIQVTQENSS